MKVTVNNEKNGSCTITITNTKGESITFLGCITHVSNQVAANLKAAVEKILNE